MTGKVCKCGKEFNSDWKRKKYCSEECRVKFSKTTDSKTWYVRRGYKYRQNYGITMDEYNEMFDNQEGRCRICKKHQSELKMSLCVDHNHDTGAVRGLLCQKCNKAIGLLQDDPINVASALEYLS